ncbi:MAG: hypothetical protein AB7P23_05475 [Amphiplicatus sp.]
MRTDRLIVAFCALSVLLSIVGAVLLFTPVPTRHFKDFASLSSFAEKTPVIDETDIARLERLFDLSDLPAPQQPAPPPPDPMAELLRFSYLGGARSGEMGAALFGDGGSAILLKTGEQLAGYTLISFDDGGAEFRRGDRTTRLSIRRP